MRKVLVALCALAAGTAGRAAEPAPALPDKVTFSEHIAPLVYGSCTACHRPGEVAPFTLTSYADAKKKAKTMLRSMHDRQMPPWQPEPGHGEFRNERRLTAAQIALFEKWVESGMAEGDAAKTPALPKFPVGWQIGTPDLIVKMDKPFKVPAAGPDIYQNFVIPLNLKEDKWVTAVEFRSTAPATVHHVLYQLDDAGNARKQDAKTPEPGFPGLGFRPTGSLGGWAVGATPEKLPDGLALPVKKGADLVLQTHFHPSGKAEEETLTVGIYFADKAPARTLTGIQLPPVFGLFSNVVIPAGKKDFIVKDEYTLPVAVDLVGVSAHAHYLGKSMTAVAVLPDKTVKKLFYIKDWDFNWQGQYFYKEYVRLPKGTVIKAEVTWDNSAGNPRNPSSPPVEVTWGEETKNEMGSMTFRALAAREEELPVLRTLYGLHIKNTVEASGTRQDKIDWAGLGIPVPPVWQDAYDKAEKAKKK
jgi:hypothetical protein